MLRTRWLLMVLMAVFVYGLAACGRDAEKPQGTTPENKAAATPSVVVMPQPDPDRERLAAAIKVIQESMAKDAKSSAPAVAAPTTGTTGMGLLWQVVIIICAVLVSLAVGGAIMAWMIKDLRSGGIAPAGRGGPRNPPEVQRHSADAMTRETAEVPT